MERGLLDETEGVEHTMTSLGVTYRAISGRPRYVTLARPQGVMVQCCQFPQEVGRVRPLALNRGPYGDVHMTFLGDVLRMSWRRNFAERNHILGEGPTDIIDNTSIAIEAKYLVNVTCQLSLEKKLF